MKEYKVAWEEKNVPENSEYTLNNIRKEEILDLLRKRGCRITKQRSILIDVILESDCSCCKEVYYMASKKMPEIGVATIYRMINSLEEIGAIKKKNIYCVCASAEHSIENCVVELENQTRIPLSKEALQRIIEKGMEACGYIETGRVKRVICRSEA